MACYKLEHLNLHPLLSLIGYLVICNNVSLLMGFFLIVQVISGCASRFCSGSVTFSIYMMYIDSVTSLNLSSNIVCIC